jgi:hypothetical protein
MKSLASVFKKTSGAAKSIFKKGSDVAEDVFKKGSDVVKTIQEKGPGIAEKISQQSQNVADVLGKVSKISNKIAASPITSSIPIIGGALASTAGAVGAGAKLGQVTAGKVSGLTNPANYKKITGVGSALENVRDIKRRAGEVAESAREGQSMFA